MPHFIARLCAALIAVTLFLPLAASAQAPGLINFQAEIGDAGSLPAELSITFELHDAATDGTLLWSEQQTVMHVDGRIRVLLGSSEAFPDELFSSNGDRFLDMIVDGTALDERFPLTSVAYSLRADHADNAGPTISRGNDTRLNLYTGTYAYDSRAWIEMWGQETGGGDPPGRQGELTLGGRHISFWTGSGTEDFGEQTMHLSETGELTTAGAVRSNAGGFIFPDGSVQTSASSGFSEGDRLVVDREGTTQILVANPSETDDTFPAEIYFSRSAVGEAQQAAVGVSGTERDFFVWVNGEDRMNIDAETGNVGLGTRSPADRLQIGNYNGSEDYVAITSVGGNQTVNGIKLRNFSDDFGWTIENDERLGMDGLNFKSHFDDPDGVSRLFLSKFGGVGVGTSTPLAPLHIEGASGSVRAHPVFGDAAGTTLLASHIGRELYPQARFARESENEDGFFDVGQYGSGDFVIEDTDAPRLLLRRNGNLWISGGSGLGGHNFETLIDLAVGDSDTGLDVPADGELAVFTNGTERIRVNLLGRVGIGTDDPTNILTIPQDSDTDPIADAWTTYSSRRWKSDIRAIEDPLETLMQLRGVRYTWTESGRSDIGLIAEEVGAVIPEVVKYEENGVDARSVDYPRLVALLIEAVKEQQADIERLEAMVASYSARQ